MTCPHDWVIKDGNSDNNAFKITICSKCLTVQKVLPRGEAPQKPSVWDSKDLRIARMSVLKVATDIVSKNSSVVLVNDVVNVAEQLENWVYRPKEG